MIAYEGQRTRTGCRVCRVDGDRREELPLRLDLWEHSSEFEWGYGGSGPAQLALALLADALGDDARASRLYQEYKWATVARLPEGGWRLLAEDVAAAARQLEERREQEADA